MTAIQKLCIFAVLVTLGHGLSLNDRKYAGKSKGAQGVPLMSLDDSADLDDESGLFYSSDVISEEKDADQSQLDALLLDIMQSNNGTDTEKCQQYKSQINEICMAKFVQRSRFRPDDLPELSQGKPKDGTTTSGPKRLSSTLATPQQICCEFRLTYLRCLLSNINFVCPLNEFNSFYEPVEGLSEICSRFFAKSSKKCRKRYRNRPQIGETVLPIDANSTVAA